MPVSHLTSTEAELLAFILNEVDEEANASHLTMSPEQMLAAILNVVDDEASASHLTMSREAMLAGILNGLDEGAGASHLTMSTEQMLAGIWNVLDDEAGASHLTMSRAELLAGFANAAEGGLGATVSISLSGSSQAEGTAIGATIGTLSVSGGSGVYTFSKTVDTDSAFTLVTGIDLDEAASYATLEFDGLLVTATEDTQLATVVGDAPIVGLAKKFFSVTITNMPTPGETLAVGFATDGINPINWIGSTTTGVGWWDNGVVNLVDDVLATIGSFVEGDDLEIAIDGTAELFWGRVNGGNWNDDVGANPATGTGGLDISGGPGSYLPASTLYLIDDSVTFDFEGGTPPAGFTKYTTQTPTLKNAIVFDYDDQASFSVTIEADNGVDTPLSHAFPITITNVAAPTITSSASVSVAEGSTLSHSLTANESVTWAEVAGGDASKLEISGSTVRWVANGVKDYEAPDDANTDNAYVYTVRATSVATGDTTDQIITVTVTNVTSLPVNTVAPVVSGTETEGETLSVTTGTWTGDAPITYAYQWYQGTTDVPGVGPVLTDEDGNYVGIEISGATASTYLLVAGDVDELIFCDVTATNDNGSAVKSSNATDAIAAIAGYLLDLITATPTSAISTRKLRAAYAGYALDARSGAGTLDIGFVSGELDTDAILTLAAANSTHATVETYYDQSGNGLDWIHGTLGPFLVTANALETLNGAPTARFAEASDTGLTSTPNLDSVLVSAAAWSAIGIIHVTSWSDNATPVYGQTAIFEAFNGVFGFSIGTSGQGFFRGNQYDGTFDASSGVVGTINTTYVFLVRYDGTNLKCYLNGGTPDSVAVGNISALGGAGVTIGENGNAAAADKFMNGKISEFLIFDTTLSVSDSNIAGDSMAARAGVTWTDIS